MSDFQYFVPRLSLKGFTDPLSLGNNKVEPYLWVADINNGIVKKKGLTKIAGSSNYSDIHSEPYQNEPKCLDNQLTKLENRAAPIIQQIRINQFQTTLEERIYLANFIGIQLGRVPIFRQHIDSNIDNVPLIWLQDYLQNEEKLKQKFGQNAEWVKEYVLSGKPKVSLKFKNETLRKDFVISLALNLGLDFGELIFRMQWVFFLATGDATFFASYNPARLMSNNAKPVKIKFGEMNEELEISIPISSTCMLWMHSHDIIQNTNIGYNQVLEVENDKVNDFNWRILPTIDKFAFCSTKEQANWVIKKVLAGKIISEC